MHAPFSLEITIRILTADKRRNGFDAGFVTLLDIDDLATEPILFDPTLVHAEEHICPIAGFCSSSAGMDREESAVFIEFAREEHFELETFQFFQDGIVLMRDLAKRGQLTFGMLFLFRKRSQDIEIVCLLDESRERLHLCAKRCGFVDDGLGSILIVPEIGGGHLLLKFNQP